MGITPAESFLGLVSHQDHVSLWPQGQLLQGPNSTCEGTGTLCWYGVGPMLSNHWIRIFSWLNGLLFLFVSVAFNNLKIAHLKSWLKLFNSKKNEQFVLLIYSEELLSKHILGGKKAFE